MQALTALVRSFRSLNPRPRSAGRMIGAQQVEMQYTCLGGSGLRASVAGLGAGGYSRLGRNTGRSLGESVNLVRRAYELGINVFDTCNSYGTSYILRKAFEHRPRDSYLISCRIRSSEGGRVIDAARFEESLHSELRNLRADYVDLLQVGSVSPAHYDQVERLLLPAMQRLRAHGKARLLGIGEAFLRDPGHSMLVRALATGHWDLVLTGFNVCNQSARDRVLPAARSDSVGVLSAFAVRRALCGMRRLRVALRKLASAGLLEQDHEAFEALQAMVREDGARSLLDLGYRFVRHEPGIHVSLFGTGDIDHLEADILSLLRPPLPEIDRARLIEVFGHIKSLTPN